MLKLRCSYCATNFCDVLHCKCNCHSKTWTKNQAE